jgi:hypothetical protein
VGDLPMGAAKKLADAAEGDDEGVVEGALQFTMPSDAADLRLAFAVSLTPLPELAVITPDTSSPTDAVNDKR